MKASLAKYPHHHSIFLDIFSKSILYYHFLWMYCNDSPIVWPIEQKVFATCLKENRQCKKKWGIQHFHNITGLFHDPKQLLWPSTLNKYVLTPVLHLLIFCIFFGKRWSIERWISVGWQQPKVRRILRGGWVVGHAIGNWRGNWDEIFHHFLGRFLCGFGCIPPNWQILVSWLWWSGCTPPFLPLALPHKERLYTGLTDSRKCNSDTKYH